MADFVAFAIPGEPIAFARSGGNGKVRFTPKRQRDFMAMVKLAACQAMNGSPPLTGPVELKIRAVYRVPTSWPKKRAAGARWRTSKPDSDNIAKIVADACNEIVFGDDAQVASLIVEKIYGPIAGLTISAALLEVRRLAMTARQIPGRHRGGDMATQRAKELGISRATWFRRVKLGLIEKPAPPPNAAERHAAWKLRREERRRAANAADQSRFARWIETLKVAPPTRLESHDRLSN